MSLNMLLTVTLTFSCLLYCIKMLNYLFVICSAVEL